MRRRIGRVKRCYHLVSMVTAPRTSLLVCLSHEDAAPIGDLDVQKTVDVNTRRGFRVVMRDEPVEQYMHDHPDLTSPLLELPPQN